MTNDELIATIRNEIERQMKFYDEKEMKAWDGSERGDEDALWYQGHRKMCAKLLSFLSTLEPEKPVPADLEEAADEMAIRAFPEKKSYSTVIDRVVDYNAVDRKNYRDGIIAGSKWQKEHDAELIEIAYNDGITIGMTKQKEQMMKDAVKWLVDDDYDELIEKGRFILGSVGIGYNGYYIPYSDLLKLPKEDEQ